MKFNDKLLLIDNLILKLMLLAMSTNNILSATSNQQQLTQREREKQRQAVETPEQRTRRLERTSEYRKRKNETETDTSSAVSEFEAQHKFAAVNIRNPRVHAQAVVCPYVAYT